MSVRWTSVTLPSGVETQQVGLRQALLREARATSRPAASAAVAAATWMNSRLEIILASPQSSTVIPGRAAGASPESSTPLRSALRWIPDRRFAASGMTVS